MPNASLKLSTLPINQLEQSAVVSPNGSSNNPITLKSPMRNDKPIQKVQPSRNSTPIKSSQLVTSPTNGNVSLTNTKLSAVREFSVYAKPTTPAKHTMNGANVIPLNSSTPKANGNAKVTPGKSPRYVC